MTVPARIRLAAAHQRLTAEEVAQHALLLVALLEQQCTLIEKQHLLIGTLARSADLAAEVLKKRTVAIRAIQSRVENGQARTARQLLAELAAVPHAEDPARSVVPDLNYELPLWATDPQPKEP